MSVHPSMVASEQVVAANLAAYNARDLEAFMACFAPDVQIWDQQTDSCLLQGHERVRMAYAELFANSPHLHSHIVRRVCMGNVVIDHELVTGRHGGDLEILITYQVLAGRIARVWLSRAPLAATARVRLAQVADASAVAAIGRETYVEHFAHIWSPRGLQAHVAREFDAASVAAELAGNQASYFLAESDSGVVGFAKLRYPRAMPMQTCLTGSPVNSAELQKIYLRTAALHRGTGAQLLAACIARASELGYSELWLDVLERNVQATCFYLRQGFTFAGKESFQTDRQREVMLVMNRALPQ
jgi:GNAT superfamily N-acetyltransferase